jgi:putative ABC transport system permease protein
MRLSTTIISALQNLRLNWGRSLLTILGIVIGIVAIVLVIALGGSAKGLILQEIESIGAQAIIVRPGRQPDNPGQFAESAFSDSLKERDAIALRNSFNVPAAKSVNPAILVPGEVTFQDNVFRATSFGWTPDALQALFSIVPAEGAYFTSDDIRQHARVAVIGDKVKKELFGQNDAIGQYIKIRDRNIRVVGVFAPQGQVLAFNVDEVVLMPYTTAQKDLLGIDYYHEIFVEVAPGADAAAASADIKATLRETHGITNPDKDDFFLITQQDVVESLSTITRVLTIFLVAMASISLVVGGVGIMNIMLVSVTERTQEIGLRKAVGATNKDIRQQFLAEAILLTIGGGLLGTSGALLIAAFITIIARVYFNLNWPYTFPFAGILLGVGTAAALGLTFGLYPAQAAAKKHPIEALRYE